MVLDKLLLGNMAFFAPLTSYSEQKNLYEQIVSFSGNIVTLSAIVVLVLVVIMLLIGGRTTILKSAVFFVFVIATLATGLALAGANFYLFSQSADKGLTYKQAEFEIWACETELELRNPTSPISNRIGNNMLFEKNDQRIHYRGVNTSSSLANLETFFEVIGGEIAETYMRVPLSSASNEWYRTKKKENSPGNNNQSFVAPYIANVSINNVQAFFVDGQKCGNQEAKVQVFVYRSDLEKNVYWQERLSDPANYIISNKENVPPGDCLIFEFSPLKKKTDKLCPSYGIMDSARCQEFGAKDTKSCILREVESVLEDGTIIELSKADQRAFTLEGAYGQGAKDV